MYLIFSQFIASITEDAIFLANMAVSDFEICAFNIYVMLKKYHVLF